MTADPDVLRAIATARDALTPAQIAAKTFALNNKVQARLQAWADPNLLATLLAEIASESALLATANTGNSAAATRESQQASYVSDLNAQIADLQQQIAIGAPPALRADIEERDEVHALLTELGIAIP